MRNKVIRELLIPRMDYLFDPPGMLLVGKTPEAPETTSILVRGAAGTGKTTLAVALAHAIARAHDGVALYLTTEFVPTELVYKALTLGLPEGSVIPWRERSGDLAAGTVLAEHLLRTRAGEDAETSAERKRAAIEAIDELLSASTEDAPTGSQGRSVRAVVIDAFGLPELDDEERALRATTLALIQALELNGVSVIIVEEATPEREPWLPFVVDVVFEIALVSDPETGELLRKLVCRKSRYRTASPGPHDYGLDRGKPAVWPDVLPALLQDARPVQARLAPPVFFPINAGERELVSCPAGTVLVSDYDKKNLGFPVIKAFTLTPGLCAAQVDCGPIARVFSFGPGGDITVVPESEGLFSLTWHLIEMQRSGSINAVLFNDLDYYFEHSRPRTVVFRMIEMVRVAGLTVCLHGRSAQLSRYLPVVDYFGVLKWSHRLVHRSLPRRTIRGAWWWLPDCVPSDVEGPADVKSIVCDLSSGTIEPSDVVHRARAFGGAIAGPPLLWLAVALHLAGAGSDARKLLVPLEGSTDPQWKATAAAGLAILGEEMLAARIRLSFEGVISADHGLWNGLCALHGPNDVALDALQKACFSRPSEAGLSASYLLRALAARGRNADADALIERIVRQASLPQWFQRRLWVDTRLESNLLQVVEGVLPQLEQLARSDDLPLVHRAECFHNLGVARERLGDRSGALSEYRRALELNPLLEAARVAISELGG